MKIGIIGCGKIAEAHVKALSLIKDIRELIFYDVNINFARKLKSLCNTPSSVCINISELAKKSDGFIVCTPNNSHLSVIENVFQYNWIPFVCEKPLSNTVLSARRIREIAHPISIISFNYRYNKIVQAILHTVINREFGELNYFSAEFNKNSAFTRNHITWRDSSQQNHSSGALGDLSCHLLDLFCLISSQKIYLQSVKVSKGTRIPCKENGKVEVDDNGYVFGAGEKGTLFRIKASKSDCSRLGLHLNLVFTKGEISFSTNDPKKILITDFSTMNVEEAAIRAQQLLPDPEKELPFWADSFFYMLQDWCESLRGGCPKGSLPSISSGMHIQDIIEMF